MGRKRSVKNVGQYLIDEQRGKKKPFVRWNFGSQKTQNFKLRNCAKLIMKKSVNGGQGG